MSERCTSTKHRCASCHRLLDDVVDGTDCDCGGSACCVVFGGRCT